MKFPLLFIFCCLSLAAFAQMPGGMKNNFSGKQMNVGHFYGKVVDGKTAKPIEFATIQLFQQRVDSVTKQMKPVLVSGALSETNGDFSLENLPVFGEFAMVVSALGYDSLVQKLSFNVKMNPQGDWQKMLNAVDKDLGNLKLNQSAIELSEVVVSGEEPLYSLELDKRVYNVSKDPSNAGGTAEDVLKKVPSVNVDLDGNITVRNAAPQLFVDGRPTTLSIDQIPADLIEKIEVITNPSAKYDASGGQSGIINIVMKKNRRIGYNGNLRFGIDQRAKMNLGGDINLRQDKVNLFASGHFNQRKFISYNSTERFNTYEAPLTNIYQDDTSTTEGLMGFANAGLDYFLSNRNTVTLSGTYNRGLFEPYTEATTLTDTLHDWGTTSSLSHRINDNERNFRNLGGALLFKHLFPHEGEELTADLNYNQSRSYTESTSDIQYVDSLNLPLGLPQLQRQEGTGLNKYFTIQSDYKNPITENMLIEGGVRAAIRKFSSENHVFVFDYSANDYVEVPDINNYEYNDQIYAAYATFSNTIDKFQYQAGLRLESSFYSGILTDENQTFENNFPISLFPTGFVTYEWTETANLQLSYTRRIDRPGFFQLMPYTDYSDTLNLSRGNPDLEPQFTNSLEFSYDKKLDKSNSIVASLYWKNTYNMITRYQQLVYDTVLNEEVIINTYINANSSELYGLEITSQHNPLKWLSFTTNLNFYQSFIDGSNIEEGLTNSQFSWFAKLGATLKLPENFTLQANADYQSKTSVPQSSGGGGGWRGGGGGGYYGASSATLQGYVDPVFTMELALKKEFFKSKSLSATLSMSDVFGTRKYETHYDTDFYTQVSSRFRDPHFLRLNINWRFGKFDTSLFKRRNLRNNGENMQDMQQGL